jgi:hypothetical protein
MARATTTNQQISGTLTAHNGLSQFSMAGWLFRAANGTIQAWGTDETASHNTSVQLWTDNKVYFNVSNGLAAYGVFSPIVTGWNHYCFTFDGSQSGNANRLKGYINGLNVVLSYSGTIPAILSSNVSNQTLRIGRAQSASQWSTGSFAELAMWASVLSSDEAASLGKGFSPIMVAPQSLILNMPLINNIQDVRSGIALTNTSTTVAAHPRVYA